MRTLMISTDRSIFKDESEIRQRLLQRSNERNEDLNVIVFATKSSGAHGFSLSPRIQVFPTLSWSRWFYVMDAIRIGKHLKAPDLVTAQDPFECGLVGWWLARRFRRQLELQIHTDFLSPYFIRGGWLNFPRVFFAKFLLPRAGKIRAVSERIAESVRQKIRPRGEIRIEPIVFDNQKFQQAKIYTDLHKKYPQFKKIILMASRLTREKNIVLALQAMKLIVKDNPDIGLIIAGSGPMESDLKLVAKNSGLEANVIFESWTDDIASYYKTCDLFLLTSWYEGRCRSLIEAGACACRIISTDVVPAREIGAVVTPYDASILSTLILENL